MRSSADIRASRPDTWRKLFLGILALQIGYVIFVQWKPVRHSVNSNDVISSAEAATAAFPCEPCPAPAPCLAVAAPKRSMVPVTDSYFCPKAISDPAAWMKRRETVKWARMGGLHHGIAGEEELGLDMQADKWFCDKLHNNIEPWVPHTTQPEEVVIGIYSGEGLFYSRAAAVRDTWLSRFPHSFIFAAKAEPHIPVVGLAAQFPDAFKNSEHQNAQSLQMYGIVHMYAQEPNRKHYFIVGCDTYINEDYFLRFVDTILPTQHFVSLFHPYNRPYGKDWHKHMVNKMKTGPGRWPEIAKTLPETFMWCSGAAGFVMSNQVVKEITEHIEFFLNTLVIDDEKKKESQKFCSNCPDVLTGMLISMLGYKIEFMDAKWRGSVSIYAVDGKTGRPTAHKEMLLYHYVQPRKMINIDQRAVHEKLDRLVNSGDANAMVEYFRHYVDASFDTLRSRQAETAWLASKVAVGPEADKLHAKFRPYDIPFDGKVETYTPEDRAGHFLL